MRQLRNHCVNECNKDLEIYTDDTLNVGGAPVTYRIINNADPHQLDLTLTFQNGPIAEVGTNGLTHEVLLAIVEDRLKHFQSGPYACRENALALTHIQEAQHWLAHRTRERQAQGIEGTHQK